MGPPPQPLLQPLLPSFSFRFNSLDAGAGLHSLLLQVKVQGILFGAS